MVKVVALEDAPAGASNKKRRIGFLDGQFSVPDDFDTLFAKDIEDMFCGEDK